MDTLLQFLYELLFAPITIVMDGITVHVQQTWVIPVAMGISALSALGTSIASGIQNRKNSKILSDLEDENQERYLQEYYRGALENDSAKAYLKRLDSEMERRDKALENSVVATGATHENALAQKQANNEVVSDAIAGLVEREDARKSNAEARYLNMKTSLAQGHMNQNAAVANNWAHLGEGISSAAGTLASAYMLDGKVLQSQPSVTPQQNNSSNPYWNNKLNNLIQ